MLRALTAGHRLAYMDEVTVIYNVHDENFSAARSGASLKRKIWVIASR